MKEKKSFDKRIWFFLLLLAIAFFPSCSDLGDTPEVSIGFPLWIIETGPVDFFSNMPLLAIFLDILIIFGLGFFLFRFNKKFVDNRLLFFKIFTILTLVRLIMGLMSVYGVGGILQIMGASIGFLEFFIIVIISQFNVDLDDNAFLLKFVFIILTFVYTLFINWILKLRKKEKL